MKNREHMPLIFLYLMTVILLFSLSACGKSNDAPDTETQRNDQAVTGVSNEGTDNGILNMASGNDDAKILIAYFTAAENSGVDAISSASYTTVVGTAVGRVRAVADMIRVHTGGELFSIQTSTIYPADGGERINQAADEQDEDFRPELTSYIEKLDDYDVVFIGFPNWLAYHNLIQCTQA